jgi:hypothetical protein
MFKFGQDPMAWYMLSFVDKPAIFFRKNCRLKDMTTGLKDFMPRASRDSELTRREFERHYHSLILTGNTNDRSSEVN